MNLNQLNSNNEDSNPDRRRLLEALEACRPGSDDLDRLFDAPTTAALRGDADLAARYERLQQFDAAIGRAFDDVAVPAGLEGRLMAALAADALVSAVEANGVSPSASVAEAAPSPAAVEHRPADVRWSRRRWMAACGGATAATAAGLLGVWFFRREPIEMTLEEVLDEAFAFHQSPEGSPASAVPIDLSNRPTDFPLSRAVGLPWGVVPRRRNLDGRFLGRPGAAYELMAAGQPRATLYVLGDRYGSRGIAAVPDSASGRADKTTGNRAVGVWREGELLYVFVVEGDEHRYRQFFSQSAGVYA